jgi:hypothetical protein
VRGVHDVLVRKVRRVRAVRVVRVVRVGGVLRHP